MAFTVNTNLMAQQAYLNLNRTSADMASSMAKLSSGLRINTAADDAAGLSISQGLTSQVDGSNIASRNAQDGINVIQTADGALGEVHSILQRMRDLAVQAGNDSNNTASRTAIKSEGDALGQELDRITKATNFNGINLLDGTGGAAANGTLSFQIGADGSANSQISVNFGNLATSLTVGGNSFSGTSGSAAFLVDNAADSATTITNLDTAIANVSAQRSTLGASQNRLTHAMNIANTSAQNLSAANSHITDTDMAAEMVTYTKDSILSQAGTAMLAQANQSGQGILKLLG
ncbi:flagellin N-terminal helical domain-containing protein [Sinomonas sp.]|jgi:flagellin|uniref:flagellin N-terminal helical domain-containing protein n=1 Tax=Sinomonas sp. TaxID=1914986 RepID=UPI002FE134E0